MHGREVCFIGDPFARYEARERPLVISESSGNRATGALRICLRRVLAQFVRDLVTIAEASPD